ncbi:hypothetical protein HN873_016618, partial [Arachis hypogaea]
VEYGNKTNSCIEGYTIVGGDAAFAIIAGAMKAAGGVKMGAVAATMTTGQQQQP